MEKQMIVRATSLKIGDIVKGSDAPVSAIAFANGLDGKERHMIGGRGVDTAYAVRLSFTDGTESLVHPSKEIFVLARRGS
jgi:hypothetical protein